jgi:putative Holliday junction resolvase
MRVMALDVGDRRIGVAVSDPGQLLARGLEVLRCRSTEVDIAAIASLAEEHEVEKIIVGYPRRLDGTVGEQARKVEAYAARLQKVVKVPVILWDEGLSTVQAQNAMIEAGSKRRERKRRLDAVAAAVILQDYLDSLRWKDNEGRSSWTEKTS